MNGTKCFELPSHFSRREFMHVGFIGGLGLSLADFLQLKSLGAQKFYKSKVDKIIRSHIHDIIQLINEMETLASSIRPTPEVEISLSKISQFQSFTETQTHQLKKAIRHAFSLEAPIDEIEKAASQASDSRSAIRKIYQIIELYRAFP